jgi:hypothetical protein
MEMTPVQGRRYYDTGSPLPPFKLNLHGYHLLLPRLVHRGDRLLYSGHILLHCRYTLMPITVMQHNC